jgi:hypothetical protein
MAKSYSKVIIISVTVVLLLAGIGLLIWFLITNTSSTTAEATTTEATTTEATTTEATTTEATTACNATACETTACETTACDNSACDNSACAGCDARLAVVEEELAKRDVTVLELQNTISAQNTELYYTITGKDAAIDYCRNIQIPRLEFVLLTTENERDACRNGTG